MTKPTEPDQAQPDQAQPDQAQPDHPEPAAAVGAVAPAAVGALSARRAVALVAGRELVARGRTKAFAYTTGIMIVSVVALVVILHFVSGSSGSSVTVGVTPTARAAAREASRKLDKAASAGVIHKNQAANKKSAINKKAASL